MNTNFLVEHEKLSFLDIVHFLINKMYHIRGSTSRGRPSLVSCSDNKQAEQNKIITKNRRKMKTIFVSILMMLSMIGFTQNATIDGSVCASASDCPKYVCENSTLNLIAGITSGSIDSVKWRERIYNGSSWEPTYTTVGTGINQSVPVREATIVNHVYRYQLIVYSGGSSYYTLCEMYVNANPTATLLSNYTAICEGTTVTFTASDGGGGATYNFQINGASAQNTTTSSFASSTLADGDVVTVTITNSTGCSATSASIAMTVHDIPQATSVVGNTPSTPVCPGMTTPVTITGLTGTGPWTLEIWNTVGGTPTTLYFNAGTTTTTNCVVNVPVLNTGQNSLFLKVSDAYCNN